MDNAPQAPRQVAHGHRYPWTRLGCRPAVAAVDCSQSWRPVAGKFAVAAEVAGRSFAAAAVAVAMTGRSAAAAVVVAGESAAAGAAGRLAGSVSAVYSAVAEPWVLAAPAVVAVVHLGLPPAVAAADQPSRVCGPPGNCILAAWPATRPRGT